MAIYRIHRFSKLTGVTPHVIRAWERRHNLVKPERGANRYRLYSDEDVMLFRYLKGEIDSGHSIGELAELGREELLARAKIASLESTHLDPPSERLLAELVQAVQENDRVAFERKLNGAIAVIPFEEALQRFLLPLQERIGQLWHDEAHWHRSGALRNESGQTEGLCCYESIACGGSWSQGRCRLSTT